MPQPEIIKITYKRTNDKNFEKPYIFVNNEVWKWHPLNVNYETMGNLNNFAVTLIKNDEEIRKKGKLEIIIK